MHPGDEAGGAAAPMVSSRMRVEEAWIDYNGHLNMAYYNVLFDRGVDEAFLAAGLGPDYLAASGASFFTAEVHVSYLRELHAGTEVVATLQILDLDAKRVHFFQELRHADEGWLSATSEQMALHVDMSARRVAPWPASVHARLEALRSAHAALPVPERAGRRIRIPRRTA